MEPSKETDASTDLHDRLAPFLHPTSKSLPFSTSDVPTTKRIGQLDQHLNKGRAGLMDRSDPSLHTSETADVASDMDDSQQSNIRVRAMGEVEENMVEQSDHSSLQDMEEGLSRTWQSKEVGDSAHRASTPDNDFQSPVEAALEWSRKSRLEALKALPPLKRDCPKKLKSSRHLNTEMKEVSNLSSNVGSLHSIQEVSACNETESAGSIKSMEEDVEEIYVIGGRQNVEEIGRPGTIHINGERENKSVAPSSKCGSSFGSHRTPSLFGSSRTGRSIFGSLKSKDGSTFSSRGSARLRPKLPAAMSMGSFDSFGKSVRSLVVGPDTDTGNLTNKEYALIELTLKKNFLFKNLCKSSLHDLILNFYCSEAVKGDVIVRQGDTCENGFVYVIAEGLCSVIVDGKPVPGPYGTLAPRNIFGELGVLNHARRAATISVKSDRCVLFQASAEAFTKAVDPNGGDEDLPDYTCSEHLDEDLQEIDDAIDQLCGSKTLHDGEIIRQYQPSRLWLWSQWQGTILQHNIRSTLIAMLFSLIFVIIVRAFAEPTWDPWMAPDEDHPWIQVLSMIKKVWIWQTTFTTFVLTFYVGQAFQHFRKIISTSRAIQGRLNDFVLIIVTSLERENGTFTPEGEALVDDIGSSARLFHAFFWASQARRFKCLATPMGFERMAQRGIMTPKQVQVLRNLGTEDGSTKFHACLEWMMIRAWQGIDQGFLNAGTDFVLLTQMCEIRTQAATVGDDTKARMPLAYTHFVQILVDTFVFFSPFALYADLGVYSILCVGMITLFYTGLLDLGKIFLDPMDNENYTKTSINLGVDLGVLTRESNHSSVHYKLSGSSVPFDCNKKLF